MAFVHIGKTGGTTLIHILRRNFFLKSCDVRPLHSSSKGTFSAQDLRVYFRINPLIECIMGHSVRPYSDIEREVPDVRYITLLREPMQRCVSQYLQRVDKYGHIGFEQFLTRTWLPNLQTRFIAGAVDLDLAKESLAKRFFLVGVIEEFDSFLVLLRKKLGIEKFDIGYTKMRVAKDKSAKAELLHKHRDRLLEIHQADLRLYDYARHVLLRSEQDNYGPDFARDLAAQIESSRAWRPKRGKSWLDYIARRAYYEPVTSVIRLLNGLPAKGLR